MIDMINKSVTIILLQISFSSITFPALLTAYIGQAAYLRKFPGNVDNTFYDSIPGLVFFLTLYMCSSSTLEEIVFRGYYNSVCVFSEQYSTDLS